MKLLPDAPLLNRLRSYVFVFMSILTTTCFTLIYPLFAFNRYLWPFVSVFFGVQLKLLQWICGIRHNLLGRENLPPGPCILAARHEATWETIFLPWALNNPAIILKAEILTYPLFGGGARRLGYIGVDRSGKLEAVKKTFEQARQAATKGRRVLIFPSGTRDPKHRFRVQPGVSVLYRTSKLPCVPIVLNSGDKWIYGSWLRRPGTITVQILPAIPPGLPSKQFMARLTHDLAQPAGAAQAMSEPDMPSVASPSSRGIKDNSDLE